MQYCMHIACILHAFMYMHIQIPVLNPRRACTARVTVVLSVCVRVCVTATMVCSTHKQYSGGNENHLKCRIFL